MRSEGPTAAARRAAQPSPETTRKLLQRANAETTMTTEKKENETGDVERTAGDLPGYVPTGEERWIK